MATIELMQQPVTQEPTQPGWYVIWETFGGAPRVAWWNDARRGWRWGPSVLAVLAWAGPLPSRAPR